jgi:hypothetical protein
MKRPGQINRMMKPVAIDRRKVFVFALTCLVLLVAPAGAHELRPTIATISFDAPDRLRLELSANLEALIAGIGPEHGDTAESDKAPDYDRLRALSAAELRAAFEQFAPQLVSGIGMTVGERALTPEVVAVEIPETGDTGLARISTVALAADIPAGAETLVWRFDRRFGDNVIRLAEPDGEEIAYAVFLAAGASEPLALKNVRPQSAFGVFADYLVVGFDHIVPKGLDHILFVVGLFLLSPRLRPLLWQVSSFTLAHSLTLALGMLGLVSVPPSIVEPLIAASIVYVAVENMLTDHLQRWRPVVVFAFGLLHGLGFAGVLEEFGLSPAHFVSGLVGFNLGVEFGQLAVIAACFLAVGLWFRSKDWYRRYISVPGSALIAMIGFYWFIARMV